MNLSSKPRYGIFKRLRAYASHCRNFLISLVKYRRPSGCFYALSGLWHQFTSDAVNVFSKRNKAQCNICNWNGARFYPSRGLGPVSKETVCPVCDSFPRQRFLVYYLNNLDFLKKPSAKILHAAPEKGVTGILKKHFGSGYIGLDLSPERDVNILSDLAKLGIKASVFDMVFCFAVLEHIKDDRAAIAEIFRILKPAGLAMITVPQDIGLEKTLEWDEPNPLEHFHYRLYGGDFASLLEAAGFSVRILVAAEVADTESFEKMKLAGTRIYLARKE